MDKKYEVYKDICMYIYIYINLQDHSIIYKSVKMYATRLLSMYKMNPSALSDPPPSGPNSGYLVILDEEAQTYCCFGLCKDHRIKKFPIPQNKNVTINYSEVDIFSIDRYFEEAMFIPVLNQPLSSNRYYVIRTTGKYQGYVFI